MFCIKLTCKSSNCTTDTPSWTTEIRTRPCRRLTYVYASQTSCIENPRYQQNTSPTLHRGRCGFIRNPLTWRASTAAARVCRRLCALHKHYARRDRSEKQGRTRTDRKPDDVRQDGPAQEFPALPVCCDAMPSPADRLTCLYDHSDAAHALENANDISEGQACRSDSCSVR